MEQKLPTTVSEIKALILDETVKRENLTPDRDEEYWDYKTELIHSATFSPFTLVTYRLGEGTFKRQKMDPQSNTAKGLKNSDPSFDVHQHNKGVYQALYNKHIKEEAIQHFSSYCAAWMLDLKTGKHVWIPDEDNHTIYIGREYKKGIDPFSLAKEEITPPIQRELSAAIPKLVGMSHNDLNDNAALSKDNTVSYFDLNVCLNYSGFWADDDIKTKKYTAIMIDKMLDRTSHADFYESESLDDIFHFENTDLKTLLNDFEETRATFNQRKNLNTFETRFLKQYGGNTISKIGERLKTGAQHLKAKL